jgi:hypothetical protein
LQPEFGKGEDPTTPLIVPSNVIVNIINRPNTDRPCVIKDSSVEALIAVPRPICDDKHAMGNFVFIISGRVFYDETQGRINCKVHIIVDQQTTAQVKLSIFQVKARY